MKNSQFEIGQNVIRTKGDYVVGRKGTIIEIDSEKNRARVNWIGNTKTWVSFKVIELIPNSDIPATSKVMYNGIEVEAINFGKIDDLVKEYKADPNCRRELWIAGEQVTAMEKEQFMQQTK